jgi:hypothetical protein
VSLGFDSCLYLLQASIHIVGFGTLLPSADRITNWSRDQYVALTYVKLKLLSFLLKQTKTAFLLSYLTKDHVIKPLLELADPLLN